MLGGGGRRGSCCSSGSVEALGSREQGRLDMSLKPRARCGDRVRLGEY